MTAETVRIPSADHLARAAGTLRRVNEKTVQDDYRRKGTDDVIRLLQDLILVASPSLSTEAEVTT